MGFIFLFISNLIIPIIMILIGKNFTKNAPESINKSFGYRTNLSMKNEDTWNYSQKFYGKLSLKMGNILIVLTIIIYGVSFIFKRNSVEVLSIGICVIQILFLIMNILLTEIALRKKFKQ